MPGRLRGPSGTGAKPHEPHLHACACTPWPAPCGGTARRLRSSKDAGGWTGTALLLWLATQSPHFTW